LVFYEKGFLHAEYADFYGVNETTRSHLKQELLVSPIKGRLLAFSAGRENPHRVKRVLTGSRYVLSFWFTCEPKKAFAPHFDKRAQ